MLFGKNGNALSAFFQTSAYQDNFPNSSSELFQAHDNVEGGSRYAQTSINFEAE